VKGYESYASRSSGATAPDAAAAAGQSKAAPKGYDQSNLMIGTPEMIYERIVENQKACSFSEITLMPQFGTMPYDEAAKSVKLFAEQVLPEVHKMDTPLHASALPETASTNA
jgi:alkanesulfonate monooxygenase SsuD/methylene tetrahydromethanopterin reductase-like flavin-dependent oxidoreductase (luciferase family)